MANALYPKFKQRLIDPNMDANGAVDLNTDTIKAVLRDASTVYNAAHTFLSELAGATIGAAQTLTSPTVTNGVFDAADAVFPSVTAGQTAAALVIYKDSGAAATSPLIAFIDTATGLPITANGTNITITWDNGASKIFSL